MTDPTADDVIRDQLERGALGALLTTTDPDRADALIDTLGDPAGFTNPAAAHAWTVAADTWVRTGTCDTLGVATALRGARPTVDPLWLLGCASIDHLPVTHEQALQWATQVRQRGRHRDLLSQLTRAVQVATTDPERLPAVLDRVQELARPATGGAQQASTWRHQDPAEIRAGLTDDIPQPTILARDDGTALLYPSRVNAVYGEPGGGKTWFALLAVAHQLAAGHPVLYLDFEDRAAGIYGRLQLLGVDPDRLWDASCFRYARVDEALAAAGTADLERELTELTPTLVVLDGVGESMSHEQLNPYDNPDVVTWWQRLPRRITRHPSEPAVLLIDHVAKATQDRGQWAIGAQAKVAAIDGAAYTVDAVPDELGFAVNERGSMAITVAKDRLGAVGAKRQRAALFILDSSDDGVQAWLRTPTRDDVQPGERHARVVPTYLMEQVSRYVETYPGNSLRAIVEAIRGKKENVKDATRRLVAAGYINVQAGPNRSQFHLSVGPYREADPLPRTG